MKSARAAWERALCRSKKVILKALGRKIHRFSRGRDSGDAPASANLDSNASEKRDCDSYLNL